MMAEKKKLQDVFKTVGLPPYTYVKPAYYGEVRADISQPGKHLLIEPAQSVPLVVDASALQISPEELKAAILLFYSLLDEQQRRLFAGLESIRLGHGGDRILAEFLGQDPHTVARGREQLLDHNVTTGRTRRSGGGRKPVEKKLPTSSP